MHYLVTHHTIRLVIQKPTNDDSYESSHNYINNITTSYVSQLTLSQDHCELKILYSLHIIKL